MQYSCRIALIVLLAANAAIAQISLSGRVVDEDGAPLAHARISAHQAGGTPAMAESGPAGNFKLSLPGPGAYQVSVQRTGYFQLSERVVEVDRANSGITFVLNPNREVFQSV